MVSLVVPIDEVAFHTIGGLWEPDWMHGIAPQGNWSVVNECTIGLEMEGYSPGPYPDVMLAKVAEFILDLSRAYGIPLGLDRLLYHSELQGDRKDPEPRGRTTVKRRVWEVMQRIMELEVEVANLNGVVKDALRQKDFANGLKREMEHAARQRGLTQAEIDAFIVKVSKEVGVS